MITITIVIEETKDKVKMDVKGIGMGTAYEIMLARLVSSSAEECHKLVAEQVGEVSKLTNKQEIISPLNRAGLS